jgi:hypothetical protein
MMDKTKSDSSKESRSFFYNNPPLASNVESENDSAMLRRATNFLYCPISFGQLAMPVANLEPQMFDRLAVVDQLFERIDADAEMHFQILLCH